MDGVTPAPLAFLPDEHRLEMPMQSLWDKRVRSGKPDTGPRSTSLRRFIVFALTITMTAGAAEEMYQVLQVGGITIPEACVMVLFLALFAWIALSFVSMMVGFFALLFSRGHALGIDTAAPLPTLSSHTALLLPTYNEDPHRVMARLQAIAESVAETGQGDAFDYFILSDTTDAAIWIAEEAAFLRLRTALPTMKLYYRHRTKNVARKAGNISEWVTRFGGAYDHMVVLDADSLMEGDTIVRMVGAMETHPKVGLIQTLPILINGNTIFARIQQFAGRVYGPLIARGIAWWHGAESNYWGHNAIIRVEAFATQAGLPLLRGGKPFGGHILSHDFVEAALMRRAGWGIHMVATLGGSFEECPPTLTDYAMRDRRWCQGNLQHIGVLPARGLHWVSRLHLLTGIGSYITSPLWLMFLLVGILISLQAQFIRPEYFPRGATLFPQWPAQDPVRAAYVFIGTMGLLIVPKLLGYLVMLTRGPNRRGIGGVLRGFISVLLEIVISALIAPVMMLMQVRSVIEILLGRDSGWSAQRRDDGTVPWGAFIRQYAFPTVLGLLLGVGAYVVSEPLLLWMLPVVLGLLLAIPVASLTARSAIGRRLRRLGLLLTPEEYAPPEVLRRANELGERPRVVGGTAFAQLAADKALYAAHLTMLGEAQPRRKGEIEVDRVVAIAKLDDADTWGEAEAMLTEKEIFATLASRDALDRLFTKPVSRLVAPPAMV